MKLDPENAFAPPDPPETPPVGATRPTSNRNRWIAAGVGVLLLGLGVWLVSTRLPDWLTRTEGGSTPTATSASSSSTSEGRRIQATLFYVSADGTGLVETGRNVLYGATPAEQARRVVEAQIAAAPEGLVSAIPSGSTVRALYLTDTNEAYVDLGGSIVSGQIGGSLNEALTVYAIVNAVIANIADITAVQNLVEGKEVDSLAGHVDLRAPLGKSLDWIQKGSPPS